MHRVVHEMIKRHRSRIPRKAWWEFETRFTFWLAALFVVVEALNKLKIADKEIERLKFLCNAVANTYNIEHDKAAAVLSKIPLIHLNGQLGYLYRRKNRADLMSRS
jgi:hypothetical protein